MLLSAVGASLSNKRKIPAMEAGGTGMTFATAKKFLEVSGADREASDIVNAAGLDVSDPKEGEQGYARYGV